MDVVLGQSPTIDFPTHNPLTGAISDADALPTCEIFEGSDDVPVLSPVVVKRVGKTGDYQVTFAATAANGFDLDNFYNVIATAVVAGVTAKSRIASFKITSQTVASGGFSL